MTKMTKKTHTTKIVLQKGERTNDEHLFLLFEEDTTNNNK